MIPLYRTIVSTQWRPAGRALGTAILSSLVVLILASPACSDEPLRIGILLSLSGSDESLGRDALLGIELAHARKPTVQGRRVEMVVADAGSDPTRATCAMFRLVERERVSCVIGDVRSSSAIAASHYAERRRIPLISLAGVPSCVAKDRRFTFWTGAPDKTEATWTAMACRTKLGASTVAVICDKSEEYSITVAREFQKAFVRVGGRVAWQSSVGPGERNFEDCLKRADAASPDVLFAPLSAAYVALLAKQARTMGLASTIMTTGWAEHRELIEAGGCFVERMYIVSEEAASASAKEYGDERSDKQDAARDGKLRAWAQKGSRAYFLVLEAVERARSTDAEKICAALRQRHGWPRSAAESYSTSDICGVGLCLRRVENGRFILIDETMKNQETPPNPPRQREGRRERQRKLFGQYRTSPSTARKPSPVDGGISGGHRPIP